ncbi:MAG: helix-turn-helix domain-containing protein, partial [Candidatus Enteromonas sp.]
MTTNYSELLHRLMQQQEGPCLELKERDADPERIGKYISSLSNMAAYLGQQEAYLVFGVRDADRAFVGADIDFDQKKVGSIPLRFFLEQTLAPKGVFEIVSWLEGDKKAVLVRVAPAISSTTTFRGQEYG